MSDASGNTPEGRPVANNNELNHRRASSRIAPETLNEKKVSVEVEQEGLSALSGKERQSRGGGDPISRVIVGVRSGLSSLISKNKTLVKRLCVFLLFAAYNAYLVTAIAYTIRHDLPIAWCDGLGFLIVCTAIVYWSLFYYFVLKGIFGKWIHQNVGKPLGSLWSRVFSYKYTYNPSY